MPQPFRVPGIWPEFSLLNHSCIPNTTATLIGDRLVVRAASLLPKGAQLTTNYLDTKCGVPLSERRRALQVSYAFRCGCARCKVRAGAGRWSALVWVTTGTLPSCSIPPPTPARPCCFCQMQELFSL
jgi:hypothetical protein